MLEAAKYFRLERGGVNLGKFYAAHGELGIVCDAHDTYPVSGRQSDARTACSVTFRRSLVAWIVGWNFPSYPYSGR